MPEQIDVAELASGAGRLVDKVASDGQAVVVQQDGRPAAVLISAGDYAVLQRWKLRRQARFHRDLALIHRAADEAALVNSFSDDQARDLAKQAQQVGRGRMMAVQAVHGAAHLPHFGPLPTEAGTPAAPTGGPTRTILDVHLLLTYLLGGNRAARPLLEAWADGQLELLVPPFSLMDLQGSLDVLAEQGRLDPEAAECLLELLAREGEPAPDPLLPPGLLSGGKPRVN